MAGIHADASSNTCCLYCNGVGWKWDNKQAYFLLILVGAAERKRKKNSDGILAAKKKQHPQGDHSFNYW